MGDRQHLVLLPAT